MRNPLKLLLNLTIKVVFAFVGLIAGLSILHFVAPRGGGLASIFPEPIAFAQDDCGGGWDGNNGTPHPCSEISCGDYMCQCPPPPTPYRGDCYYWWNWNDCYSF